MTASIRGIAYALPPWVVTNAELAEQHPDWNMSQLEKRTRVLTRHLATNDETSLTLGISAVENLVYQHPEAMHADAILFCTQTPAQVMPPNSTQLHEHMGLGMGVFALDFTHACSGYVYGLGLAQGLLAADLASSILLVTADTYSSLIDPDDRGPATLFGDGAAATWITSGDRGLVDIITATSGRHGDAFRVPRGSSTVVMDGARVLAFVNSHVPGQVTELLRRNELGVDDVDLFVFHQASGLALDALGRALRIPPEKVYSNLERVGNLVSASIPVALRDAMDEGLIGPGSRVVLCGFGVGMTWATALVDL